MEYLKVQDNTYMLPKRDIYRYSTCQFCGSDAFKLQRLLHKRKDLKWKRTCSDCGKTTALVRSNP